MDIAKPDVPPHVPPDRVVDFDMYADPGLRAIAQSRYPEMLKEYPEFFWTPRNGGHWVVIGKDAVDAAFHDYELFGSFNESIPHPPDRSKKLRFVPIQMDPPQHGPYRELINPLLGPTAVRALSDEIRKLCVDLITNVADKGGCAFTEEISLPLPVLIFMRQMGLPQERFKELAGWAQTYMNGETLEVRRESFGKFWNYLDELLLERSENPQSDWISRLLAQEMNGERLSREDIVLPICAVLFVGGLDTVKNSLGHFMRVLAGRPDLQKRLREDPSIIPDAIEELFRLLGGTNPPRIVRKDGAFRGIPVRHDELVLVVAQTAGVDTSNVDHPSELDFDREQKPHNAFGTGPHRCAGSNLARLELRIFFEEWFSRIPEFRIAPGTKPTFTPGIVNAIDNLQLAW